MRAFTVTGPVALPELVPFLPNYTIVVVNMSTAANTLQSGDALTGPFNTVAVIPASSAVEVTLDKPFVSIEDGAGNLVLLGN